jgi:hypothetical protein
MLILERRAWVKMRCTALRSTLRTIALSSVEPWYLVIYRQYRGKGLPAERRPSRHRTRMQVEDARFGEISAS